jgi:hypothetical protein
VKRVIVILALLAVALSGCGSNTDEYYTTNMPIDHLEWKVLAKVQELQPMEESGWTVPEGAVVYKTQEEVKTHKVVGYKTKYRTEEYQEKIGYYLPTWRPRYETRTRKVAYKEPILEPVYATRYYYTIERWVNTKTVVLGEGRNSPCKYKAYECAENERVNVEEQYTVWFAIGDHWQGIYVDKEQWEALSVGQEVTVERNQYGVHKIIYE